MSDGKTRCPACGKGFVHEVVVSRSYNRGGRRLRVDGLLADKCDACGELTWSEAELRRGDRIVAIKLGKVAA